jgi:peroxiredoxin
MLKVFRTSHKSVKASKFIKALLSILVSFVPSCLSGLVPILKHNHFTIMTKNILIAAIAGISLMACKHSNGNGEFTVSGKISHVAKQPVYLQHLPSDGSQVQIVDSSTLGADGSYKLKTVSKEEGLYVVSVPSGVQALFINDDDDITINVDSLNARHPEIKGSEASTDLYKFMTAFIQKDSIIGAAYQQAQQGADSSKATAMNSVQAQVKQLNDFIKRTIAESESPALVQFALGQAASMQTMSFDDLFKLASDASNRFKESNGLATLKARLQTAIADAKPKAYSLVGKPAPNLTMQDVNGKPVSINDFKGKYLLVDFWASWCGPCRQENPNVVAAFNQYKDKNFTILGVSLDDDKQAWVEAIKKDGLVWNQMSDLKQWASPAVETYQFDGIPFNVLIDPQGTIIASSLRGPELEAKLAEVLK